jgi:hypothetical protein
MYGVRLPIFWRIFVLLTRHWRILARLWIRAAEDRSSHNESESNLQNENPIAGDGRDQNLNPRGTDSTREILLSIDDQIGGVSLQPCMKDNKDDVDGMLTVG